MRDLYPLKFKPIAREMIWGGDSLRSLFNKPFPKEKKIGESWEISAVPGIVSVVNNGFLEGNSLTDLIEVYMGDLVGEKIFERFGTEFPLLIKLLDARDDLSIQVHPGDELALLRHNSRGKTEMWYVLEAAKDAGLISGFNREVSRGIFTEKLESGQLLEILNFEKVLPGDVFFMPAGRVHAICRGIVLAEIQQTSDITYRVYDWDRRDESGKPRELHTDLALDAIDYGFYDNYKTKTDDKTGSPEIIADCRHFTTLRLGFEGRIKRDYSLLDSFIIYICTKGSCKVNYRNASTQLLRGETLLLPAITEEVVLNSSGVSELLEVYIKS